jgi:uncharacterized Fe-S cluster-containing MiaB family protein
VQAQRQMDKESVKEVYKYLQKNNNLATIKLMESFVGCLRGIENATNIDVEVLSLIIRFSFT